MPEGEIQPAGPVTLTQIQAELRGFRAEVNTRLDTFEGTLNDHTEILGEHTKELHDLGLNGLTPYVKPFFEQYAASLSRRQAWITVRQDVGLKLRWLASPATWLKTLGVAFLGGLGFTLADRIFHVTVPFDLFK